MKIKECLFCGKKFTQKNNSQKYCSCSCNTKSQRVKQEKELKNKKNVDVWDKILKRWEKFPPIDKVLENYYESDGIFYK